MAKSTTAQKGKKTKTRARKTAPVDKKTAALSAKIEALENQVSEAVKERDAAREKNIRLLAEFDNYKRRTAKDRLQLIKYSCEDIATALLPVMDDLDRTIASTPKPKTGKNSLLEGVIMVRDKFDKLLSDNGIRPFKSVGEKFNTDLHEALMIRETEDMAEDLILEELEKGYKYHDRVIRHAKVIVSKARKAAVK